MRKSQAAPTATAIRNGSGLSFRLVASPAAIGAIISTVAALLRKGVTAMATTRISAKAPVGGTRAAAVASQPAIRSVPPVLCSASLTGMSAPSRIRIGHSIAA